MAVGGKAREITDINMTPMIDILLVLIVIFIIVQPLLQKSIDIQVPIDDENPESNPPPMIVLEMEPGRYTVNTQPVSREQLAARLFDIYSDRPDKLLFIKANPTLTFEEVMWAMDTARGSGVEVLGAMF
jgi:biopolymer transport protein ExbD